MQTLSTRHHTTSLYAGPLNPYVIPSIRFHDCIYNILTEEHPVVGGVWRSLLDNAVLGHPDAVAAGALGNFRHGAEGTLLEWFDDGNGATTSQVESVRGK